MQIHELSKRRPVNEGLLDSFKNRLKGSAPQPEQIAKQTQQFAQQLAAEWEQKSKALVADELAKRKEELAKQKSPAKPAGPKYGDPITAPSGEIISKPGDPSYEQLAKRLGLAEAFNDLPGAKPPAGNPVDPKLTTSVGKQGDPRTSMYSQAFKKWANERLATRERTTGKTIDLEYLLQAIPGFGRKLDQLLTQVYNTRNDATTNTQAVTAYLDTAMKGIQQVAKEMRTTGQASAEKTIKTTGNPAKDELLKQDGWTVTV